MGIIKINVPAIFTALDAASPSELLCNQCNLSASTGLLGKYTIELMIPVVLILLMFFNIIGAAGLFIAGGIVMLQMVLLGTSKNNLTIHDRLAKTVVVDNVVADNAVDGNIVID